MTVKDAVVLAEDAGRLQERSRWLWRISDLLQDPRLSADTRRALRDLLLGPWDDKLGYDPGRDQDTSRSLG